MGLSLRRAGFAGIVLGPMGVLLVPSAGCGRTGLLDETNADASSLSSADSSLRDDGDATPPEDEAAAPADARQIEVEVGPPTCTSCPDGSTCVVADGGASCRPVDVEPPRPVAPLSTSRVTTHRPTFHWVLAGQDDGARIDICLDRACAKVAISFSAEGTSAAPAQPLGPGVYYWRLHGTEGAITGTRTSSVWEFTVPVRDSPVDTSWGTRFDIDGDGLSDLAVSGSDPSSAFTQGVAYVYPGTPAGPSSTFSTLSNPPRDLQALVRSAGDVNGDGFGDLLVGSEDSPSGNEGGVGAVLVYSGGPGWTSTAPALLPGAMSTLEFGAQVQSAGDVNGDGYCDILVSGVTTGDGARAFLYLGSASGLAPSPTVLDGGILVATMTASDINGDGLSDVVVGVIGRPGSNSGAIDVYLGTPQGLTTSPTVIPLTANPTTPNFFEVLIGDGGDLNGDGFGDIVVGLPQMGSSGSFYVYLGSASGLQATPIVLPDPAPPSPSSYWGNYIAGGGDIDGDGFDDLVAGNFTYAMPGASAYVYRGGPSGVSTTPSATLNGPSGVDFGEPVAFLGDINGDGFDDVAVGSYSGGGSVYVFLGSATGLTATPIAVGAPLADPKFGGSIASFTTPWCTGEAPMDRVALAGITLVFALATAALATACGGELAAEAPDAATDGDAATTPDVTTDDHGGPADASTDSGSDATGDAPTDSSPEAPHDASAVGAPRPIAPLSTATVTSQQPTLRWQLAPASDGAQVEICRDRACKQHVVTFLAPGSSGAPTLPLAAGVYFWRLHGTSNGDVGVASSPTWEMFVGARSAPVDTSWGSVPDLDGDGIADALTGTAGVGDAGAVYVYQGGPIQLSAVTTLDPTSGGPPDYYGQFLVSAGDIDGDGFPEVLVNTSYEVWMYRGGPGGLSTQATLVAPSATNQRVESASGVGDVDGDGYGDVAVAVNINPTLGGVITIYRGSATGLSASPTQLSIGDWGFGDSLAPTDMNGDGYGDFVTAATQGLYVFEGGPGGVRNTPVIIPFAWYAQNGYFVSSAGDVNGDGYGDVLSVETPYQSVVSEALLYLGSAAGPGTQPLVTASLGNGNEGVGIVGGVGDVNGDGYADCAMIAEYEADGIYLALGGASGPTLVSHGWPLPTTSVYAVSLVAAGDVNGDGVDDMLVGASGPNTTWVYLGDGTSDLQMMPAQTLMGGGSPL